MILSTFKTAITPLLFFVMTFLYPSDRLSFQILMPNKMVKNNTTLSLYNSVICMKRNNVHLKSSFPFYKWRVNRKNKSRPEMTDSDLEQNKHLMINKAGNVI